LQFRLEPLISLLFKRLCFKELFLPFSNVLWEEVLMRWQLGFFGRGLAACAMLALSAGAAMAQPNFTYFEFEVDEGLTANTYSGANSTGGLDGLGFGITEGSSAFVINNATAQCCSILNSQVNGMATGEQLNNYNAAAAAAAVLDNTPGAFVFDLGYDASGVFADAFVQIGVVINSDAGFSNSTVFGPLLAGNVGPTGNFPVLGGAAASGATIEVLDPSDFAGGDFKGLIRVSVPIVNGDGDANTLPFGTNGDGVLDFAQVGFGINGSWPGFLDLSFDNVGFLAVPEPTGLALLGTCGLVALVRRKHG
jgi:hypothetical protein